MMKLIPYTISFSKILKFVVNALQKSVFKTKIKHYIPKFKKAFMHFCVHPRGRTIIEVIGKNLRLNDVDMKLAKMTLHRFKNTSSSRLWYVIAYCKAKEVEERGQGMASCTRVQLQVK